MFSKKQCLALILVGLLAIPWGKISANPNASAVAALAQQSQTEVADQMVMVGTWECTAIRPDSTTFPVIQTYNADGTWHFSSGSTLWTAGFSSRGTGRGDWEKVGPDLFRAISLELLYKNHNETTPTGFRDELSGRFYVDQTVFHDDATDTLCSGPVKIPGTTIDCPGGTGENATTITKVKRILEGCSFGAACDNFNVKANATCRRLESTFPTVFPGL